MKHFKPDLSHHTDHQQNLNNSNILDTSVLPLSERIRLFQEGGDLNKSKNNKNEFIEEAIDEPAIDYSAPPSVSIRAQLFSSSEPVTTTKASNVPSARYTTLNVRKSPHSSKKSLLSSDSSSSSSVIEKAKLIDERAKLEEKIKRKKHHKDMDEDIDETVPPELLSLADRVKKFSIHSSNNSKSKHRQSKLQTPQKQSPDRKNDELFISVTNDNTSPVSSIAVLSQGEERQVQEDEPERYYQYLSPSSASTTSHGIPPPPSYYLRNYNGGSGSFSTSRSSNRNYPSHTYHGRKYRGTNNRELYMDYVDWDNGNDQCSMTSSSISEI